jgi:hypothetical protein
VKTSLSAIDRAKAGTAFLLPPARGEARGASPPFACRLEALLVASEGRGTLATSNAAGAWFSLNFVGRSSHVRRRYLSSPPTDFHLGHLN